MHWGWQSAALKVHTVHHHWHTVCTKKIVLSASSNFLRHSLHNGFNTIFGWSDKQVSCMPLMIKMTNSDEACCNTWGCHNGSKIVITDVNTHIFVDRYQITEHYIPEYHIQKNGIWCTNIKYNKLGNWYINFCYTKKHFIFLPSSTVWEQNLHNQHNPKIWPHTLTTKVLMHATHITLTVKNTRFVQWKTGNFFLQSTYCKH